MATKKPKTKPLSYYQRQADKKLQELGRQIYTNCFICKGEYSCLHHFVKKSQSTELRYNWKNLIPICNRCHCGIHQGKNDMITGQIVALMGTEWLKELETIRKQGIGKYYGKAYYQNIINKLHI